MLDVKAIDDFVNDNSEYSDINGMLMCSLHCMHSCSTHDSIPTDFNCSMGSVRK